MKQYKITAYYVVALLVLIISACTKMDDYKLKFTKGGSIVYPGKMDSVKFFSGFNRVKLTGLFTSDPKIVKYRVFWNSKQDSVEVPVVRTTHVDTVKLIIPNLPEGLMSFEVRTYDAQGHISIPTDTAVNVYGANYQSTLVTRGIADAAIQPDGSALITWVDVNSDAGIANMEIKYSDALNKMHDTLVTSVPIGLTTSLPNFKAGNTISYTTWFAPTPTAIDKFTVPFQTHNVTADVTSVYFTNYQQPFTSTAASGTGRWRDPIGWTVTSPVLNHQGDNGGWNGGWGSDDGTVLAMEAGWGAASVINGKMFQTFTLPAGNYTFSINLGNNGFSSPVYIVAAAGTTLPDAALVSTSSLGYASLQNKTFDFKLAQPTQVSIGFVSDMTNAGGWWGEYWRVTSVKLLSK
ncbi:MAG: DUF4998 domain-containing protein [Sphingobacteriales bacterium]